MISRDIDWQLLREILCASFRDFGVATDFFNLVLMSSWQLSVGVVVVPYRLNCLDHDQSLIDRPLEVVYDKGDLPYKRSSEFRVVPRLCPYMVTLIEDQW